MFTHENTVCRESENKACGESINPSVKVLSSTDNPYAISDAMREALQKTRKSLLISAPWVGKVFIDLVRNLVPRGIVIKLLAKRPTEEDRTHVALDTFSEVANSEGYKLNVKFKPYLHAKFIVIDDTVVLSGSFNPTDSGIYYNDELMYVISNPENIKQHIQIFGKLWDDVRNISWENFQLYTTYKRTGEDYSVGKAISSAIVGYFGKNHNMVVKKAVLVEYVANKGFDKTEVVGIVKNLIVDGVLYEPKHDFLRMTEDE